ncbi:MAG TPA: CBS domain-containing protein [Gemmataceae bacterium]|nr:CBS domain-containing protein [Gemmataceae bacterium]
MLVMTKPFLALTAKDLMNGDVVRIPRDMGMQAAARWLDQMHVSGAPVVDEQGRCVGVLSSGDFVACCAANNTRCAQHRAEANRGPCTCEGCVSSEWQMVNVAERIEGSVRDHMTPDPVTAPPETTIGRLAQMMVDAHIHRLIIIDEQRRPLGIVSTTDIVAAVARVGIDE